MASDPTNWEKSSNMDPPPSILPLTTNIMTLLFHFPMPGPQTSRTSTPFVTLSSMGASTITLQHDRILQLKTLLASLQTMLAE